MFRVSLNSKRKIIEMDIPKKYIHMENLLRNVADLKDLCDVVLVAGIDKQK